MSHATITSTCRLAVAETARARRFWEDGSLWG